MSEFIINPVGSAEMTIPSKINTGDTLRFNITNSDSATAYTGTIMAFTFPWNCTVKIHAYGARGSYGNLYTYGLTDKTRSGKGAYVYGTFEFSVDDQLMILVGQHGYDAMTTSTTTRDLITGAGGGGTFIVKRMLDGTGDSFVGTSLNKSNTTFSGWKVSPLIIAAGGNGSRDNGYSGTGTIYGGLYTTGSAPTYATYCGGGYASSYGNSTGTSSTYSYGLSFLYGGLGSQYRYTRGSKYALAGFGGGGSNADDNQGGGGGGYYGGLRTASAQSFNAGIDTGGTSDYNAGDGYVIFEILDVHGSANRSFFIKANGKIRDRRGYVKKNGIWRPIAGRYTKISANKWVT